jgi:phosphatidylinositol alpha-1,6-mannosyltransferase
MLFCFKNAKKIFAVSSYTKQLLINEGVEEDKIVIVPNGTDPQRFNPNIDFKELMKKYNLQNKKIILSISRLVKRKNFGAVIEVMPDILKEVPDAVYVIGGTGPMKEEWKKLAEEKEVEDKVIFIGYIPDEDLPKYYAMCDVFVMPSIEMKEEGEVEGFGIAFLEANACGKPVIGGKSGGVKDAIVDGETGFLVEEMMEDE